MSKRQKFAVAAIALLVGILLSRVGLGHFLQWRFRVVGFAVFSGLVTLGVLKDEDFSGIEWLTLPILPVMFSLAALLLFPLLPNNFDSVVSFTISADTGGLLALALRMVFLAIFAVGYYATVLAANIYNVAAVRNIQLIRVAHSVGFLMTVATALLSYVVVASLHLPNFLNLIVIFAVTLPLIFQAVWSVMLEKTLGERTVAFSFLGAAIIAQVAWVLSFWPISISILALFLTAIFYEIVGIIQYHLSQRLNDKIVREFVLVTAATFFIILFTAQWGN